MPLFCCLNHWKTCFFYSSSRNPRPGSLKNGFHHHFHPRTLLDHGIIGVLGLEFSAPWRLGVPRVPSSSRDHHGDDWGSLTREKPIWMKTMEMIMLMIKWWSSWCLKRGTRWNQRFGLPDLKQPVKRNCIIGGRHPNLRVNDHLPH